MPLLKMADVIMTVELRERGRRTREATTGFVRLLEVLLISQEAYI
jgi:hypothetical protein